MKDIYKSDDWKSLDKTDRAQLLLVMEGVKRGAMIRGNYTSFMRILEKAGLDYELNSDKYSLRPVFTVGKTEDIKEGGRKDLMLPKNAKAGESHKINGWFLSYSACCTEQYIKKGISIKKEIELYKSGKDHLSCKFGREISGQMEKEGSYSEIFNYLVPSFTPCGIDCEESKKLLTKWKDVLEANDPEAAKELVRFNKIEFAKMVPEIKANSDYLKANLEEKYNEVKLDLLKTGRMATRIESIKKRRVKEIENEIKKYTSKNELVIEIQ